MNKITLILLLLALVPGTLLSQQVRVGEQLEFNLKYGIIPAGHSSMKVTGIEKVHGHTTYKIESRTRSSNFVDTFYKVRDEITTWVDTATLATVQFTKSLHEGKYRKNYSVWFDYENMRAYSTEDTLEINSPMQDVLSLFYYIRSLDLADGDTIKLKNYDNDKISPFFLRVTGKERMVVPAGSFTCFVIQPFADSDFLFKYEGEAKIWLSMDRRRLPIYVKSKASFGSMILELEKYVPGKY